MVGHVLRRPLSVAVCSKAPAFEQWDCSQIMMVFGVTGLDGDNAHASTTTLSQVQALKTLRLSKVEDGYAGHSATLSLQ
jgi:hypothetical protein